MTRLTIRMAREDGRILAPCGVATPHLSVAGLDVEGAALSVAVETRTGQSVIVAEPVADEIVFRWRYAPGTAYPEQLFHPADGPFTRAADALAREARGWRGKGAQAIVNHVARQFTYGHADVPFYEGATEVPQVCSLTTGSCVDINLYLIAMLRGAGIEAGYMTGYFFPAEKVDHTSDMHCWVVTREEGVTREWDIAHHLKMGVTEIAPALDPKPGRRVPIAHSMGWQLPALGLSDVKLMAEPVWLRDAALHRATLDIRLEAGDLADTRVYERLTAPAD